MRAAAARRRWQALVLLATWALPAVFAYNSTGKRWVDGATTFYVGMPNSTSGLHWSDAFQSAMQQWNDKTSFKFVADQNYMNPCNGYSRNQVDAAGFPAGPGDAKNGADFRSTVCGNDFGTGVLAITLSTSAQGKFGFEYLQEADIIFNDSKTWAIYDGPKQSATDFRRVALHELGHAIGLDHESTALSIMAPFISNLYQLQQDDIDGAQATYGPHQSVCPIVTLPLNAVINTSLGAPDCRVKELFGGGTDDSFVDVYRLTLTSTTRILADMRSSQLDSVLVLTDKNLKELDIFDDYQGSCTAHMDKTLAAGEYLLLANTYAKPQKCGTNQGSYSLSITNNLQPVLGETRSSAGAVAAATLITGGASADDGLSYKTTFSSKDSISVNASLALDPAQTGKNGKIYVLIQLSNGLRFSKNSAGQFVPFNGDLSQMASYKTGPLAVQETINIVQNLRTEGTTLTGLSFVIYIGYALDSQPSAIQYGSEPIRFSIVN